jgi:type II secretory pathway pseudopilin PulG
MHRGFSIIEAMVAFVVLLIALSGLAAVTSFGAMQTRADQVEAAAIGQQYLSQLAAVVRAGGAPASTSTTSSSVVQPGGGKSGNNQNGNGSGGQTTQTTPSFSVSNNGCPSVSSVNLLMRQCSVTVTWNDQGVQYDWTVSTYATQQQ